MVVVRPTSDPMPVLLNPRLDDVEVRLISFSALWESGMSRSSGVSMNSRCSSACSSLVLFFFLPVGLA